MSTSAEITNHVIADRLDEAAALLAEQGSEPFRVSAFKRAAAVVRTWPDGMRAIFDRGGVDALEALPAIGPAIARSIRELLVRGQLPMLARLRGEADPEALLKTVPGIGNRIAERAHLGLGITTLEDLEAAAYDGRLEPLVGARRLAGIRASLAQRLARVRREHAAPPPPIDELLDVDREYRERAAAGTLPMIAPKRFNPKGERWLPVLHTTRDGRRYTALYSNTAHAHRQKATRDWVVIYQDTDDFERPFTVITAMRGPRRGQRIVAGQAQRAA